MNIGNSVQSKHPNATPCWTWGGSAQLWEGERPRCRSVCCGEEGTAMPSPLSAARRREERVPRDGVSPRDALQPRLPRAASTGALCWCCHPAGGPVRPTPNIHFLTETKPVALPQLPGRPAMTAPSHRHGAGFSGAALWFGLSLGK